MKKTCLAACGALLLAAVLAGCASKGMANATENTIVFDKGGTITDISVLDFSDGSYDMADLEGYINTSVEAYNQTAGGEKIKVNSVDTTGTPVKSSLTYATMEDYNAFNGAEDSVEPAATLSEGTYTAAVDGSSVATKDVPTEGLITLRLKEARVVKLPGQLMYYNEHVTVGDTIKTDGEGEAILLYETK